jgi:hypothetical protein
MLNLEDLHTYLHVLKNFIDSNVNSVTSDDVLIIRDSGCSITVTNDPTDFIPNSLRTCQFAEVKGISSGLKIDGIGVVSWKLKDINSQIVDVNVQAIYVPACPFRLLFPQQLSRAPEMSKHNGAWVGRGSAANFFYQGHCTKFPFDHTSQLPIAKTEPGSMKFAAFAMHCHGCTSDASPRLLNAKLNSNLTAIQAKLLLAHKKLSHVAFDCIKSWAAQGKFGHDPALARCRMNGLVCADCQFGVAHKQPHNHKSSINEKDSIISPGNFVALGQMISKIPGLMPWLTYDIGPAN